VSIRQSSIYAVAAVLVFSSLAFAQHGNRASEFHKKRGGAAVQLATAVLSRPGKEGILRSAAPTPLGPGLTSIEM